MYIYIYISYTSIDSSYQKHFFFALVPKATSRRFHRPQVVAGPGGPLHSGLLLPALLCGALAPGGDGDRVVQFILIRCQYHSISSFIIYTM